LLFSLLSVFSTYRLAKYLSDKTTAKIAALVLATAQSFVLSIMDARMEAPLTGALAFGIWQLVLYIDRRKLINLVLGALAAAAAFSTKGWIGPIIIVSPCFFKILLEKKWKIFIDLKTWLFFPLFILFIMPVLYAYYVQYDLHPEKVIRGMTHISGVKFILWSQNFERFGGENWAEGGRNSDYFFFYHTFLWAFLPWCIAAYLALFYWLRRMFFKKKWNHPFNFAALSFAFVLFTISFSNFKMPHYIIMLFPLAAVFTAPYLKLSLSGKTGLKIYYPLQLFLAIGISILTIILNFYYFPPVNVIIGIVGSLLIAALIVLIFTKRAYKGKKILLIAAFTSIVFNFFLNFNFIPQLMEYQGGNKLAEMIHDKKINIPNDEILLLESSAHSFDFYMGYNHQVVDITELPQLYPSIKDKYFLLKSEMARELETKGFEVKPDFTHVDYNVTTVKLKFLNSRTRLQQCDSLMLAHIYRK
jgi:4-amino-4-deoxy-L-arabinose transferase-like glycosyltransferase